MFDNQSDIHQDMKNSPRKNSMSFKKNNLGNGRLLAVINSNGTCVSYQENGSPHFMCSEIGGHLCNRVGCVVRSWKWKELEYCQLEELSAILTVKLNEHIELEYRDPYNIKLKFNCNKETMILNLGCVKSNQPMINDLVSFDMNPIILQEFT